MTIRERLGSQARMKIWLLYLRKSRQDDPNETVEEVLAKHETQLQEWAERELGGRIPEENIYREIVSGESIDARDEIKKVLARIEDPAVAGVICMEPSRLSRGDLADCSKIIDSFRFSRSVVATPYMTYDLENEMERKFFKDELLRSSDFLEYTKKILFQGRVAAVKRGCYIGTRPPYGYNKVKVGKDHTLEINEDQAPAVQLAFDMYVNDGATPYQIALKLNELGFKPAMSDTWKKDSVRVMLRNAHYAGYTVFNRKKKVPVLENGKVIKKCMAQAKEDVIIAEGKHMAIIDRDQWEAAQKLIARNPSVDPRGSLFNPLAGVLCCAKCGHVMILHPYKHATHRYKCRHRPPCYKTVKAPAIIEAVILALEEAELPALELKVKNGDGDARKIQQMQLQKLEKQMAEYRTQEERQFELLETNPAYTQEVFNRRNADLREKMDACQEAIYKTKNALPQSVDYTERVTALKAAIDILRDDTATAEAKNKVVKAIVERIDYVGPPSDPENKVRQNRTGVDPFELAITIRL